MATTEQQSPWFGIRPPEDMPIAWGARLIFERGHMGSPSTSRSQRDRDEGIRLQCLPDRVSLREPPAGVAELLMSRMFKEWIERNALQEFKALVSSTGLYPEEDRPVQVEKAGMLLSANPKKSYGYLYVGVWLSAAGLSAWRTGKS